MALSKADRARLAAHIIRTLSEEDWAIIDTHLEAFGLPTDEQTSDDPATYIQRALREADEDTLVELANNLGAGFAEAASAPAPAPAKPDNEGRYELFLSHLATYQGVAGDLRNALSTFGIRSFVAHVDVEPTAEWENEIIAALRRCDALVALLHVGFHESKWTDQEIGFVMGRDKPAYTVRFGEDPYGFIGRFQAFSSKDGNGNDKLLSSLAFEIARGLVQRDNSSLKLGHSLAGALRESESYEQSGKLVDLLELLESWDGEMLAELGEAKNNGQVSRETWNNVPARVDALIGKWS